MQNGARNDCRGRSVGTQGIHRSVGRSLNSLGHILDSDRLTAFDLDDAGKAAVVIDQHGRGAIRTAVRDIDRLAVDPEPVRNLLAVAVAHLLEIGVGNRRTVDGKFADGQPAAGFGGLRPLSADGKIDGTGCFRSEGEFAERKV